MEKIIESVNSDSYQPYLVVIITNAYERLGGQDSVAGQMPPLHFLQCLRRRRRYPHPLGRRPELQADSGHWLRRPPCGTTSAAGLVDHGVPRVAALSVRVAVIRLVLLES